MARPHDLKAQEAECLQEWSYQREGDLLPPGIILFTSPLSHEYPSKCMGHPLSISRASNAEKHSPLQQGFLSPPVLTAAAPKCEGILAVQLSSFVHISPAMFLSSPVRNSNGWWFACTRCTSWLSQDACGHPTGFVLPQHPLSAKRGQRAAKRNLLRDKAVAVSIRRSWSSVETPDSSAQLGMRPQESHFGLHVGIQSGASPEAPRPWGCQIGFCDTVPMSLKQWPPGTCDTHPGAVSHSYGTLGRSAPGH